MMKDEFLARLGLQTLAPTHSVLFPTISFFGVGLMVGAGLGLMLAPKTGTQLRGDIERNVTKLWNNGKRRASQAMHRRDREYGADTYPADDGYTNDYSEAREG